MPDNREQVITVSMTLNTKGFEQGLVLSDKQAKAMGENIAKALTIDSAAPINSLRAIGVEKDKLMANFVKLKQTITDTFNIDVTTINTKLQSVSAELDSITQKANAAANALKSVAAGTGAAQQKSSGNTATKNNTTTTSAPNTPTISGRLREEFYSGAGPLSGNERPDAARLAILKQEQDAREAASKKTVAQIQAEEAAAVKRWNTEQAAATKAMQSMQATSARTAQQIALSYQKIAKSAEDSGNRSFNAFSRIFSANFLADALANTFTSAFNALKALSSETALYAARTEELGVVLDSLARVNKVSTHTINEQEVAIQRLNITTQDTRETIARFMNVGFDLKKAGPLARVAQDLAVIGNLSTSEELDKLTVAIQTLQSRNLRSAGVFITVDEVLDKLSVTTGRARDSFSTLEKQTAVLNAVLEYGSRAAGTYEAAMETTSKQLRSLERVFLEAQNAVGEQLVPALQLWVDVSKYVLETIQVMPNALLNVIRTIGMLTAALVILKTQALQTLAVGLGSFVQEAGRGLFSAITGKEHPAATASRLAKVEELTLQREQVKEIYAEAQAERVVANARLKNLQATRDELLLQKKSTVEIEKQIALQRTRLSNASAVQTVARNRYGGLTDTINRGGVTRTESFIDGIGKVAVIGTVATAIYTAVSALDEFNDSLYQLKAIDLSASTKTASDLKRIAQDVEKLNAGKVNNVTEARKVVENMSTLSRSRLTGELRILDVNTKITAEMQEQLKAQLGLEASELQRKQKATQTDALAQVRNSSYNVGKTSADLELIRQAEEQLRGRIGDRQVNYKDIGYDARLKYGTQSALAKLGQILTPQGEAENWEGFSRTVGNGLLAVGDDAEVMTLALADVQAKLAETGNLSEKEVEKRKQAVKDYVQVSKDMGESDAQLLETLRKQGGLTADQFAEAAVEVKRLKEEADAEIKLKIDAHDVDALTKTFDSFKGAFNKYREEKKKAIEEVVSQKEGFAGNPQKIKEEVNRTLGEYDVKYLQGTQGKEGIENLQSAIAQRLQESPNLPAQQILDEELAKLEKKDEAGQALVKAFKGLSESGAYTEEAAAMMQQYLKKTEKTTARFKYKELLTGNLDERRDLNERKESNQELENFVDQSLRLGKSADEIRQYTNTYKLLFSINPQQAIEAMKDLNAVNKEAIALEDAQRADRQAKDPRIQELRTATQIQTLETEVYNLRRTPNPRVKELEREKKLITDIRAAQDRLEDLKRGVDPELESLQRQVKIEEAVLNAKNQQKDVEDEIAILKRTQTIPVVNAQLLAEKAILQSIQDRRNEEQKLTADIAVEMAKRANSARNYVSNVNKITAQVFLDKQKADSTTDDNAIKSFMSLQFEKGNEDVFTNNPLVQEAALQSEKLAAIEKNGGVMGQKADTQIAVLNAVQQQSINNTTALQSSLKYSSDVQLQGMDVFKKEVIQAIKENQQSLMVNQQSMMSGGAMSPSYGNTSVSGSERERALKIQNALAATGRFDPLSIMWGVANAGRESGYGANMWNPKDVNGLPSGGIWQMNGNPNDPKSRLGKLAAIAARNGRTVQNSTIEDNIINKLENTPANHPIFAKGMSSDYYRWAWSVLETYAGINKPQVAPNGQDWGVINNNKNIREFTKIYGTPQGNLSALPNRDYKGSTAITNPSSVKLDAVTEKAKKKAEILKQQKQAEKIENARKALTTQLAEANIDITSFGNAVGAKQTNGGFLFSSDEDYTSTIAVMKQYEKYFNTIAPTKAEKDAFEEFNKQQEEFYTNQKKRVARNKIDAANLEELRSQRQKTRYQQFLDEMDDESDYGAGDRRTDLKIIGTKRTSLENRFGDYYTKFIGEDDLARANKYLSTYEELVRAERERDTRATSEGGAAYIKDQEYKFTTQQITAINELQDKETQLNLRRKAFADSNSDYNKQRLGTIAQERKEAEQNLIEEIDAAERYNKYYLNSEENRTRISKEAYLERLNSYKTLVESMIQLDTEYGHANDNLNLELLKRQKELRNEQEKEYGERLKRQLELENEYRRKFEPFNADEFRNRGLEKITGAMKDQTTIMSDLFSDSFDAISGGFGNLVDKMTDRMGIFGSVVGNLLKSIFNNVLADISKRLLDTISPKNTTVAAVESGAVGMPSEVAKQASQDMLNSSVAVVGSANNFIAANNGATSAIYALSQNVASVGIAMIEIVRQVGETITRILSAIPQGGGGTGSSQAIAQINNAATSGVSGVSTTAGGVTLPEDVPGISATTVGNTAGSIAGTAISSLGGAGSTVSGVANQAISGILSGKGLKSIGKSAVAALPMIGAGLGGLLGGKSAVGGILGQAGGLLGGTLAYGLITGGLTGATGGGGLFGATAGLFGLSGGLTLGIGAAIAGAFLLGSYLFGRAKRRKEEAKKVTQVSGDARKQLEDLLKSVKNDKIDGDEAITRAQEIRDAYVKEISGLKTKTGKRQAQQELTSLDGLINQIKAAAKAQAIRKELDERIVPTYASGGMGSGLIRVSQGESLFIPHSEGTFAGHHIAAANIPNFGSGGMYTGVKIRGNFDGKDNILTRVPKGTVIANPRQVSKIRQSRGFATGGVAGRTVSSSTAQGTVMVQPPSVTAIIVFSPEEAEKLGRQIPNSVIVGKVRQHVQQTGSTGLAGDVLNSYR